VKIEMSAIASVLLSSGRALLCALKVLVDPWMKDRTEARLARDLVGVNFQECAMMLEF
jgi:hypothetical protein